jgi:polysaccharide pyruvyl transferase WcaK-like protein
MKKILIAGYYGFRNLGDDILLLCSFRLLRTIEPQAEIWILSESKQPDYIQELLGEKVNIINNSVNQHFDVIIHGGGGVHFDFKDGEKQYFWLNKIIHKIGIDEFRQLFSLYKKLRGRNTITSDKRLGIGIGVGTFTPSSQKFYNSIQILADYDTLFVRDEQSLHNVQRYHFKYPTYVSTDLAFLREYWLPQLPATIVANSKKVGIVLRDWPYDNNAHFSIIKDLCRNLIKQGFQVTCYALDVLTDQEFIKEFGQEYEMVVWQPDKMTLKSFLTLMQREEVIVSSRAHGAIVGACLGIPVICLGIEPKLETVAKMLKESASFVPAPFDAQLLLVLIQSRFMKLDYYRELTENDVRENEQKIRISAVKLKEILI